MVLSFNIKQNLKFLSIFFNLFELAIYFKTKQDIFTIIHNTIIFE